MANLTINQFSERLGITTGMGSRLKNGHRKPSVSLMTVLHREFGLDYEDMHDAFDWPDEPNGTAGFGLYLRNELFNSDDPPILEHHVGEVHFSAEGNA